MIHAKLLTVPVGPPFNHTQLLKTIAKMPKPEPLTLQPPNPKNESEHLTYWLHQSVDATTNGIPYLVRYHKYTESRTQISKSRKSLILDQQ
jgi:hypothetical protein